MSAGVGAIASGEAVRLLAREPQPPRPPSAAPLQPPDEAAFTVSTINQRLASLAAQRAGRLVDFKA
jgi:hypothetical protein